MNTSQKNFYDLFNDSNDFLVVVDFSGKIVEVNTTVLRELGYKKSEIIGHDISLIVAEKDKCSVEQLLENVLNGIDKVTEIPICTKEGIQIPVETHISKGKWNNEDVLLGISRNLSEIKFSELKFQKIFSQSLSLMVISDAKTGVLLDVNKQFIETLGYEKNDVVGRLVTDFNFFYDDDQRNFLRDRFENRIDVENQPIILRTKDGNKVHTLFSNTRLMVHDIVYLVSTAIDVTALKNAEEKLSRNLIRQKLLADISQKLMSIESFSERINETLQLVGEYSQVSRIYIFEDTEDGNVTNNTYEWCNEDVEPQIQNLQDFPYEYVPSWKRILQEEGALFSENIEELPADLYEALSPQGIKSILIYPLLVQNKHFGFVGFDECKVNKFWDAEEIALLRTIAGMISNSFERLLYQKQLVESEMRLKLTIDNTETGLWDWNVKTGYLYLNDVWCSMLGYLPEEISPDASSWEKLIHPDDKGEVFKILNQHLNGGSDMYTSTFRLKSKNNEWQWILAKGRVVERDQDGMPLRAVGTHTNMDRQKKTEAELRRLNATKDKLFSIIAHDLRGPIGTMMQISEMVMNRERLSEDSFQMVLQSQKELSHSTFQLLENLLSWASYNSDQIKFLPKKIHVSCLVEDAMKGVKFKAEQKEIELINDVCPVCYAFADVEMVKLILRNLISNAVKFTRANGFVKVTVRELEEIVEIKIQDSGVGISSENIAVILSDNQFYSSQGTKKEKGSGLGMKLCKSFVQQNKGALNIQSEPEVGTTIVVTLPRSQ